MMLPCVFFLFCFLAPPAAIVPDDQGGAVSFYNSRVMPDGELRPYSPELDGILLEDGRVVFPYQPPPSYPEPQGYVDVEGTEMSEEPK
jgi:hypothetical protein